MDASGTCTSVGNFNSFSVNPTKWSNTLIAWVRLTILWDWVKRLTIFFCSSGFLSTHLFYQIVFVKKFWVKIKKFPQVQQFKNKKHHFFSGLLKILRVTLLLFEADEWSFISWLK